MALIKNIEAMLYDYTGANYSTSNSTTTADTNNHDHTALFVVNSSNTILIEDEDNEILWLDGIPHDRVSLVPKFNLPPKAFEFLKKNTVNYFSNNMLLTKQPTLNYNHDNYTSTGIGLNNDLEFPKYSSWNNLANLTSNQPPYLSFTLNNEDYIVYYYTCHNTSDHFDYNLGDTKIHIVKTSNYSTLTDELEITTEGFTIPLHFDLTQKALICLSFLDNPNDDDDTGDDDKTRLGYRVIKIDNNPLTLVSSTLLQNFDTTTVAGSTDTCLNHTVYWAGYDSNNNNVLLYLNNTSTGLTLKAANLDFSAQTPAFSTIDTAALPAFSGTKQLNPVVGRFHQTNNPGTPEVYFSYCPTFLNGDFQPVLIYWDKSLNLSANQSPFTVGAVQQTNIVYPANTSSSDYIYSDTFNLVKSDIENNKGNFTAYSTCFITKTSAGQYYLNHLNVFKRKDAYNTMLTQPNSLNMVTYHIHDMANASNPLNLTFHQALQVDCLDLLIENDDATDLVIISPNSIKLLKFSNLWEVTSEYDGIYNNYTKDALGRRWATKQPLGHYGNFPAFQTYHSGYLQLKNPDISLHLLDDTIPYRTSISFATPNQTYTGSDLSNSLNVDAFDETGSRIAADVVLVIEGNDMTFDSNSGTEIIITTSTIQSTVVDVTITGPGHVSVAASFNLQ